MDRFRSQYYAGVEVTQHLDLIISHGFLNLVIYTNLKGIPISSLDKASPSGTECNQDIMISTRRVSIVVAGHDQALLSTET